MTVKHFRDVQKRAVSLDAEKKWKVMKMNKVKSFAKETGKVLLFAVGVWLPFALHIAGWL